MPLIIKCFKCGSDCTIKKIQDDKRGFIFEYDCKQCNLTMLEEIPKRYW